MVDERFPPVPGAESPPPYLGDAQPTPGQVSEKMQTLLSRAVEDQMAEQRQLQLLINDIRASLTQLAEDVRASSGEAALDSVRGDLTGLSGEVRTSTTLLGERLEAVVRAINASAQAVQGMATQLQATSTALQQQQESLQALPGQLAEQSSAGVDAATTSQQETRGELASLREEIASLREAVRTDVAGGRETTVAELARLQESLSEEVRAAQQTVAGNVGEVQRSALAELTTAQQTLLEEVRRSNEELRRGLTEHVDSAVLALAEALLRRRPGGEAHSEGLGLGTAASTPVEAAPAPADDAETAAGRDVGVPQLADDTRPSPPWAGAASAAQPDVPAVVPDEAEADDAEAGSDDGAGEAQASGLGLDAEDEPFDDDVATPDWGSSGAEIAVSDAMPVGDATDADGEPPGVVGGVEDDAAIAEAPAGDGGGDEAQAEVDELAGSDDAGRGWAQDGDAASSDIPSVAPLREAGAPANDVEPDERPDGVEGQVGSDGASAEASAEADADTRPPPPPAWPAAAPPPPPAASGWQVEDARGVAEPDEASDHDVFTADESDESSPPQDKRRPWWRPGG